MCWHASLLLYVLVVNTSCILCVTVICATFTAYCSATPLVLAMCCASQAEIHKGGITPQNALQLVSAYNVVLDCTDNAPSRYLISDACVVAGKPLVSGAAIGTDGQLTVYNYGEDGELCIWLHLVYVR